MPHTVLLVDDNVTVRSLLADVMRNAGFMVSGQASDGLEAIEMVSRLNPDLVVMDFSMPRLNGTEAASVLKQQRPKLPIILLSIYADRIGQAIQKATSVDAVISKADGVNNLLSSMNRLLGIEKSEALMKQPYEKPTVTKNFITPEEKTKLLAEGKDEQSKDT